jgi:hypothetical protein
MAVRDHCLRLSLVVLVFLVAAIFLAPHLKRDVEDLEHVQSVDLGGPGDSKAKDGSAVAIATAGPEAPKPTDSKPTTPATSNSAFRSHVLVAGEKKAPWGLLSRSGRYTFSLDEISGQLALLDKSTGAELFVSDTEYFWPVEWEVELTKDGVLKLFWRNQTEAPYGATPWVSSMLPNCEPVSLPTEDPVLELLDSGLLQIRTGKTVTCVLSRAADDKGKLAIVYTGFLRTYLSTCAEQNTKLVESWTGSGGVHVHVLAYYEDTYHEEGDAVTKESITKHLNDCFGKHLKTVELYHLKDIQETAANPAKILEELCGTDKLNHQLSQWRALYMAGQQVQKYMVEHGVMYDYIFKGRLDLKLWGGIPSLSSLSVPPGGIIAPRVALDWTWYAMLHTGEQRAGVTDITAYGRPNEILTYLSLYREFLGLRTLEKEVGKWKAFNSKARVKTQDDQETCSPEGILAYWLQLNGISVRTDWRFGMGLLRGDGNLIFTCPTGRDYMCPGFVPHAAEDGTLY